jgi:tRNA threonylcarbamoyladenosine biosynthesis protein TsaB
MIVLGIETSTPQSSIAIGSASETIASISLSAGRTHHEVVLPALREALEWTETDLATVAGIAVGVGPGLFTGLRVGIEIGKTLAQTLKVPIVGIPSLDVLAFDAANTRRTIAAVIDARRKEVFAGMYRHVPGGVAREGEFMVVSPERLAAELEATGEEVLAVGNGATLYRGVLEEPGGKVEVASPAFAHPQARALVELAIPRFEREEHDRLFDVVPLYLRKSDAEISWDRRRTGAAS